MNGTQPVDQVPKGVLVFYLVSEVFNLFACCFLAIIALKANWYKYHRLEILAETLSDLTIEKTEGRYFKSYQLHDLHPTFGTIFLPRASRTFWVALWLAFHALDALWLVHIAEITDSAFQSGQLMRISTLLFGFHCGSSVCLCITLVDGAIKMRSLGRTRVSASQSVLRDYSSRRLNIKLVIAVGIIIGISSTMFAIVQNWSPITYQKLYYIVTCSGLAIVAIFNWYGYHYVRKVSLIVPKNTKVESKHASIGKRIIQHSEQALQDPHWKRRKQFLLLEFCFIVVFCTTTAITALCVYASDNDMNLINALGTPISLIGRALPVVVLLPRAKNQLRKEATVHAGCFYKSKPATGSLSINSQADA